MMRDKKFDSLNKVKEKIDDILFGELSGCRYNIFAHYNANNECTLFSYYKKGNSIHLYINIQLIKRFIEHNDWNANTSLYFCAWYVAGYIKTLIQWEQRKVLNTYCDGVIFFEVLYACCSKKRIKVFSPYICEKLGQCIKKMYVIDVYCEANTLLRVKALRSQELLQSERTNIDCIFDERMLYLKAPEVIYVGYKTPSLSVKGVLKKLRIIGKINTELNVPRLPKNEDAKLIQNLIGIYKTSQNTFWIELLAHLVLCSPNSTKHIDDSEVLIQIYDFIGRYEETLTEDIKTYVLSKNKIMIDNLTVMLRYIERSKRLLSKAGLKRKKKCAIHINL